MPVPIGQMRLVLPPAHENVGVRRDVAYAPEVLADIYAPDDKRHPAIVFIHGGPIPAGAGPKAMQMFRDYGTLAAAAGFTAVTFNHRFFGEDVDRATRDVAAALEFTRKQPEVDAQQLVLWAFSGGGRFLQFGFDRRDVLALVSYYAILAEPLELLRNGNRCPPVLIARAGKDMALLNATVDDFVAEALRRNVELELLNHPEAVHGFDVMTDDDRSRAIIRRTIEFIREHVR